jgi:nitrogen-specific signal transduction histidine kinase
MRRHAEYWVAMRPEMTPRPDLAGLPWPALAIDPDGVVVPSRRLVQLLGFEPRAAQQLAERLEVVLPDGTPVEAGALPWRRAGTGAGFQELQQWRDRATGARHLLRVRGRPLGAWLLLDLDPEPGGPDHLVRDRLLALNASMLSRASTEEPVSVREILLKLVELARELTGARYGALGVLARDGSSLKDFVHSGLDEAAARAIGKLPTGRGLLGAVIREARVIRIADLARDARAAGFPPGHPPMTTFIGVPLRVGAEVFGNFYLADKAGGQAFSDWDEALLTSFSEQASLTVAYVRQLQDEEQRLLEAVVAHAPYGLAYFPDNPEVEAFGNGAAVRMLGRVTRARDPACTFLLRHMDGTPLTDDELPIGRSLRDGAVINMEVLIDRRDEPAAPKPALVSAAPVYSRGGAALGVVVVLHDISAQKELERLREDFTAMVAHDLRTPLQAVLLQVDALIRAAAGSAATVPISALQRMKANGRRLELLIRDLLDASRIDASQVVLHRCPLDLGATVASLVGQLQAATGDRRILVEGAGDLPQVDADRLRIEQVLTNLIENAAKYSSRRQPIRIGVRAHGDGVEVSVEDRGPGIPMEELPHLFDRYYQTRKARAAGVGLGLGLFISRGLVEAHGGKVSVSSTAGVGSVFSFWLPRASEARGPRGG